MQNTYEVNGKLYSKEQLIALGKQQYPKLYWIPRIVGIIFYISMCFIAYSYICTKCHWCI